MPLAGKGTITIIVSIKNVIWVKSVLLRDTLTAFLQQNVLFDLQCPVVSNTSLLLPRLSHPTSLCAEYMYEHSFSVLFYQSKQLFIMQNSAHGILLYLFIFLIDFIELYFFLSPLLPSCPLPFNSLSWSPCSQFTQEILSFLTSHVD